MAARSNIKFGKLADQLREQVNVANRESAKLVAEYAKANADKPQARKWSPSDHPGRGNPPYISPRDLWPRTGALYRGIHYTTIDYTTSRAYIDKDQELVARAQETGTWVTGLSIIFGKNLGPPFPYRFWAPAVSAALPEAVQKYQQAFQKACQL